MKRGGRKPGQRNATPEQITAGLMACARLGSPERASEETGVPLTTLHRWKREHADQWQQIESAHARAREAAIRRVTHELADGLAEKAMTTLRLGLEGQASKEQITAARETFNALAAVDRIGRLDRSQPTEITEDRRTDAELKRDLARHLADMNIPVPAELTQ